MTHEIDTGNIVGPNPDDITEESGYDGPFPRPMKVDSVYIAARYEWRQYLMWSGGLCTRLEAAGIEITSRWIKGECEGLSDAEAAAIDLEDINAAQVVILLANEGNGVGRHIETGYALGTGTPVIVYGSPESVFHHLPQVTVCPDRVSLLVALGAL